MPLKRRLSEGGDEDSNPAQESKKKKSDVASQMQVRNRFQPDFNNKVDGIVQPETTSLDNFF